MKELLTCPKCEKPMDKGFTRATQGIQWRNDMEAPLRSNWIWRALSNTLHWWTYRENSAWHCTDCSMLIIDHSTSCRSKRVRGGGRLFRRVTNG